MLRSRKLSSRKFRQEWTPVPKEDRPTAPARKLERAVSFGGSTTGPAPKNPSSRSPSLRKLAEGEACCGCLGLHCDPATTVWAHPNGLADGKGKGYKGHDHLGAFLGSHCHKLVDERSDAGQAARIFTAAQARTRERLAEIAANPMVKPWRVKAARWALDQLEKGATA
jgi:hypothetical protein